MWSGPFPLDFVEVVWGNGKETGRQIISTTEMPAFGKHHFEIPFDATGKKCVRFAAWDAAGNGALVQPVKLRAAKEFRHLVRLCQIRRLISASFCMVLK